MNDKRTMARHCLAALADRTQKALRGAVNPAPHPLRFPRSCTVTHRLLALTLVVGLLCVPALSAHHSWPVSRSSLVTVRGTVTAFSWTNPHPMISLDVRNDDGQTEEWRIGGPTLSRMERNGWTNTTVKQGDVITGIGYQFADGSKIIRLEKGRCPSSC